VTLSTLNPIVGTVVTTSPIYNSHTIAQQRRFHGDSCLARGTAVKGAAGEPRWQFRLHTLSR